MPVAQACRVAGGRALLAIRTCLHVLLPSRVPGRIDEVHREAMGFQSCGFGYRRLFGTGGTVELPVAEAFSFSLAFPFSTPCASRCRWARRVHAEHSAVACSPCRRQACAASCQVTALGRRMPAQAPQGRADRRVRRRAHPAPPSASTTRARLAGSGTVTWLMTTPLLSKLLTSA